MKTFKKLFIILGAFTMVACSSDDDVVEAITTYSGNVSITNAAELDAAVKLGSILSEVNGSVTISTGGSTGITAAGASQVSQLMKSVSGSLIITNPDGAIQLPALTTVGGIYKVYGTDANDEALASVGGLDLSYDGEYNFPNLTSATTVKLDLGPQSASKSEKTVSITAISFPVMTDNESFDTGYGSGVIRNNTITSINFGSGITIFTIISTSVQTVILRNPTPVGALTINTPSATVITIVTTSVTVMVITSSPTSVVNVSVVTANSISITGGTVDLGQLTSVDNLEVYADEILNNNSGTPHNSGGNHNSGGSHNSGGTNG